MAGDGGGESRRVGGVEKGVKVQGQVRAVMKYRFVKERQFYRSAGHSDIK